MKTRRGRSTRPGKGRDLITLAPQYGEKYRTHAITLTYKNICTIKEGKYMLMNHLFNHSSIKCTFYPEYTRSGRLHWHGFVYERNKQNYNRFLSHWRYIGFTKESKLTNRIAWHIYCIKDQYLFKRQPTRLTTRFVIKRFTKLHNTFEHWMPKLIRSTLT